MRNPTEEQSTPSEDKTHLYIGNYPWGDLPINDDDEDEIGIDMEGPLSEEDKALMITCMGYVPEDEDQ